MMKLKRITDWLDRVLDTAAFASDVSNNGIQIARTGDDISKVAFAVDGSLASIQSAVRENAELLVVHHGVSWGGGIRRIDGGVYCVVKAAMDANLALYAAHLPLDANQKYGNNWELARHLGLKKIRPAFSYHGYTIGVTGVDEKGQMVGICSGGAGEFAEDAKKLGCDVYITGEASWGEQVAAENIGQRMICAGHYETEIFGVTALSIAMKKLLKIPTVFVSILLLFCLSLFPQRGFSATSQDDAVEVSMDEASYDYDRFSIGLSATAIFPQGGEKMRHRSGTAVRLGYYVTEMLAIECEGNWLEERTGLALQGLWHWWGYERLDPFSTFGIRGWLPDGQVGPTGGLGAFYHIDDHWSLRFDAHATLGVESTVGMIYSIEFGVQRTF